MENPFEMLERKINSRLEQIENVLRELKPQTKDRVGDIKLASEITGLKTQTIYKLTMRRKIPFSKPRGTKMLRFKESELMHWIEAGAMKTEIEITQDVSNGLRKV